MPTQFSDTLKHESVQICRVLSVYTQAFTSQPETEENRLVEQDMQMYFIRELCHRCAYYQVSCVEAQRHFEVSHNRNTIDGVRAEHRTTWACSQVLRATTENKLKLATYFMENRPYGSL